MDSAEASWPQTLSPSSQAVLLMVLATLLTSVGMVVNKWLTLHYPPTQIVFWRSLLSFLPIVWLVHRQGGLATLKTKQAPKLVVRGLFAFGAIVMYCASLGELSLFSAESLIRLTPLFVFVLATLFLREKVQATSVFALGASILGVLLIIRPDSDVASAGGLLAIFSAFFYAIEIIMTRTTGKRNTAVTLFVYYTVTCLVCSSLSFIWEPMIWPGGGHLLLFALIALLNLGINICFTEALRIAPASQLAPLEYLTLVWVILWQVGIWGDLPLSTTLLGALIILVSGLWILKNTLPHKNFC